jgi:hypothetical protein
MFMVGFWPLCWPSLVMSTNMRGWFVPAGKVYLWRAVRRVEVSSTRMPVDYKPRRQTPYSKFLHKEFLTRFEEKYPGEA